MTIRTGAEYLRGLSDGREVWLAGRRVDDVLAEPVLAAAAHTVARLYDQQHDPLLREVLTYQDGGRRYPLSLAAPRDAQALRRRGAAFRATAETTFGLLGRSPDFVNTAVTAFASAAPFFDKADPRFGRNVTAYHAACLDGDPFLSHATINPPLSRAHSSHEQDDPDVHLRIVRETSEGVVVRGAKLIGTLVPVADEIVVFPLPGYRPGDEAYTIAFAIPVATPGLRIICREPLVADPTRLLSTPLAPYEEIDATCVFDDVLVPWDRVFFHGDVDAANRLYDATTARHHTGQHGIVRGAVKAELLAGVAVALAEMSGTDTFLHVKEMLGEVLGALELARAGVLAAEADASPSEWGTLTPAIAPVLALRYHFPRMTSRMIEVIQLLGGGSLLSTPAEEDLRSELWPGIERYFRGAHGVSAEQRVRLLKLAWDATGSAFGQRQMQYERYHSGDPVRLAAAQYTGYDTAPLLRTVQRAMHPAGRQEADGASGADPGEARAPGEVRW
ncbi:4-hydroxyphenylacetate 3-monooxygenase [Streptomyces ipomoeae]|uniref:4-hydroxyphenylacetate 3-monooxygenase n=2 Tax=Streptomyces ipomoeae TaxID=103232 RepID=A0AAE8W6M8_9ACTN|nr:4-hydroxyphenylacetate 3-hydroxylase N-terminal domain-containing protein [Streptomyces ipomoeae]EKX62067.1 putative 4-hydroxyphenylacetate 3-monooxygenase, oxygenase component [Streptomyces ipomoeae 91-03]MDX2692665.1 4-hydroxyphenylacetate 3-hydroxylase N-terminal domain-containing protein [Streptomyces ipomoeae]MDX2821155.1 4-hydroxyphenylacetate 3-hydroxylase N-terminal domain-containing protein [Streptomyces ipomoeae]MDX2838731.1 4-hydroxyphenylacetate 3-hydroxylase N-terminal domain-co